MSSKIFHLNIYMCDPAEEKDGDTSVVVTGECFCLFLGIGFKEINGEINLLDL